MEKLCEDVLKAIIKCSLDFQSEDVVGIGYVCARVDLSKYKARKHINTLLEEGFIVKGIRKGGYDEYSEMPYPPIKGYTLTDKAKKTPMYIKIKAEEDEILAKTFGF